MGSYLGATEVAQVTRERPKEGLEMHLDRMIKQRRQEGWEGEGYHRRARAQVVRDGCAEIR